MFRIYSKTCLKLPLSKRPKLDVHDQLFLNAVQKYCRMLQREHSAILSTFIMPPVVIKIFVLSIFERPLQTDFTVYYLDLVVPTQQLLLFNLGNFKGCYFHMISDEKTTGNISLFT